MRITNPVPRVTHLEGGTLRPLGGEAGGFGSDTLPCHVLVVEFGERTVLVDGGIGLGDIATPADCLGNDFCLMAQPVLDPERTVKRQLEARNDTASAVTDIVLTHPDRDHVGAVHDFPRARVHAHPDARVAVLGPTTERDRERIRPAQWGLATPWAAAPTPTVAWYGFDAWTLDGLGDDLVLIDLPGHATGHAGVAIRREHGWLLHAGDAYFHRHQIKPDQPSVPDGLLAFEEMVQHDGPARLETQRRLRLLPNHVDVICSHDPADMNAHRS